jgi:hypothetical protein
MLSMISQQLRAMVPINDPTTKKSQKSNQKSNLEASCNNNLNCQRFPHLKFDIDQRIESAYFFKSNRVRRPAHDADSAPAPPFSVRCRLLPRTRPRFEHDWRPPVTTGGHRLTPGAAAQCTSSPAETTACSAASASASARHLSSGRR